MDPLTAISLASNIVSFVDLGAKVLSTAWEIYNSTSGDTSSNRSRESVARQMEIFAEELLVPDTSSGKEKALCVLAQECRDLAIQILELLQKSIPKNPRSKRQVAWSTLKSLKYVKERLELQERLDNCRDQLALQLNGRYCSEIRRNLETLMSTSQDASHRVVQLQQQVEDLRQTLENTHSRDSQNHIQQLLQLSEDSFHALVSQRLIESLAFDDMYGRFDTIAKAHYNTFKWIFYGDTNSDGSDDNADEITQSVIKYSYDKRQDAYQDIARDSFLSWLSSDHGIFHICGKLGSGKSTLMKFLCEDARTKKALIQWAGGRTLIMASFFFWKPGSKLQKSMDGLLRALLYETLKSLPGLVPKILPEQWAAISSTPWQMHTKLEFRSETIREAFDRLIDSHTENLAMCFFIDGLDEYEPTLQEDNLTMVKRLHNWCGKKAGYVKMCVSSREYNVFMNHLPVERRIRMQDLTNKDIKLYILDNMEFVEHPHQARRLINGIASKADGIFLWVALVVKRARELHENSASFEEVLDDIDQLPRSLEELLKHILESLEPSDRTRAYQTFAIMMRLQREDTQLPLLAYAFIDDYNKQLPGAGTSLSASSCKQKSIDELNAQAVKKLRGYCKGLVEVVRPERFFCELAVLQFSHRTIPEFIQTQFLSDGMKFLRFFREEDATSWLLLACIRKYPPSGNCHHSLLSHLSYIIMKLRHEANLVNEPFDFEEQLETALIRQGVGMPRNGFASVGLQTDIFPPTSFMTLYIWKSREYPHAMSPYRLAIPCLISCYLGHSAYLRWKMDRSPAITDRPAKTALIFFIIYRSKTLPDPERRMIFESLSDRGFSPNTIPPPDASLEPISPGPTVWAQFVANLFIRSLDDKVRYLKLVRYGLQQRWSHTEKLRRWRCLQKLDSKDQTSASTVLKLFLEAGADASITVSISSDTPHLKCHVTLLRGKERHQVRDPVLLDFVDPLIWDNGPSRAAYSRGDIVQLTLIDIIKFVGLKNKRQLIALVKRSMHIQERGMKENDSCNMSDTAFGPHGMSRSFLLISLLVLLSAVLVLEMLFMSG